MSYESLHEKLAQLDAELSSDEDQDKTSTRDKLETGEAELAKDSLEASALTKKLAETETKTRTRERLADVEKQLSQKLRLETSTSTRDRLLEAEKQLSMRTSTKTRERLVEAERKLAEMKTKTSTRTRDDLRRVEEAIAREQARATSNYTMELFERKQEMLRQMLEKNKNVDVAFLLDCTGSMAGYIIEAKNQIKKIVEQILEVYENNVRVAFVGYRDHCDGPKRIETFQFSEDTDMFVSFLGNIRATGGGDAPEDVLGGLEAAVNLAWSSASKVIFHVGDSPQHGPRFHDLGPGGDNYYGADPRGLVPEDLFMRMKQIGVRYVF